MGLFALGKTDAVAAIKAAVDARVQIQSDGTPRLDVQSLNNWLWEQANLIVEQDVTAPNKAAATGVIATIDPVLDVGRVEKPYLASNWTTHPEYPSSAKITSSASFVSAAAISIADMAALAAAVENEYAAIVRELPDVVVEAWSGGDMAAALPSLEDRIVDTRFYVYTHVNDLGEESGPSPVSEMAEVDQRDRVNLSIIPAPAGRNIDRWRFYRSNTGTVNAAFQFIAEGPISITAGTDEILAEQMGEVLPTTTWDEPPAGLRGICEMHTGIMAGFFSNTTAFCEPFTPYAWPPDYHLSCSRPIVAQQAFGQTLVRLHMGGVDYIGGADPASMSVQTDVSSQVCASARSVCKVDGGVVFASQDGLCLANGSGVQVLTLARILRDDWQAYQPETMYCHYSEGSVYILGSSVPGVLALHLPTGRITSVDFMPGGMSSVFETGKALYGVNGLQVFRLFAGPGARTATWRSKIAVLPAQVPLAWLGVESDFANGPVTVKWFGDGVLRHTVALNSRAPVRLPPGRWLEHEVEVTSQSRWNALTMASTTEELKAA